VPGTPGDSTPRPLFLWWGHLPVAGLAGSPPEPFCLAFSRRSWNQSRRRSPRSARSCPVHGSGGGDPGERRQAGQGSGTPPGCPPSHSPCLPSPAGPCGVGQGHCPSHRTVSCLLARHACCSSLHCGAAAGRWRGGPGPASPSHGEVPPYSPQSCRCGRRSRRRRRAGRRGRACSPRAPWHLVA